MQKEKENIPPLTKKIHGEITSMRIKTGHQSNGWQVFQLKLGSCIYRQNPCICFSPFSPLFGWNRWDRDD